MSSLRKQNTHFVLNDKLMNELKQCGFSEIQIIPMGSYFAVLYDVINSFLHLSNSRDRKIIRKIFNYFFKIFLWLDKKNNYSKITTGYFVIANKNLQNQ